MSNIKGLAITTLILLIVFLLIAISVATIITGQTGETTSEDYELLLNDVLEEISTYIQIKDKVGKYNNTDGIQRIEKIAIMIKPLLTNEINISQCSIKLCDGNSIKILNYSGNSELIKSSSLFNHEVWNNISSNNFGFIVIHDNDRSLIDYHTINDNKDMAYIIIKLSEDFSFGKGETLFVTLFPSSGIKKTIILEAPLPINKVVSL